MSKVQSTKVLVVAQLALGDSYILRENFLSVLPDDLEVTVLCHEYNQFIFTGYQLIIENWPIAVNRRWKWGVMFPSKKFDPFEHILIPSAHIRELIFARFRFKNSKLLVPKGNQFAKMQKNQNNLSYLGLDVLTLESGHWYELYTDFANAILKKFKLQQKIVQGEPVNDVEYRNEIVLSPYSNLRVRYKWIPDAMVDLIIKDSLEKEREVILIADVEHRLEKHRMKGVVFMTPSEAYKELDGKQFKTGYFCDSFMSHFFYNKVIAHRVFISRVDPFHRFAVPKHLEFIDNSSDLWKMLNSSKEI